MRIENITYKELELMSMGRTYLLPPRGSEEFSWEIGNAFLKNFPDAAREEGTAEVPTKFVPDNP